MTAMNEYQEEAVKTAIYPREQGLSYTTLGLVGEAGEVANKVKKIIRDGHVGSPEESLKAVGAELGDVLWYLAMVAEECGLSLEYIANANLKKLNSRKERGTLKGSGDTR